MQRSMELHVGLVSKSTGSHVPLHVGLVRITATGVSDQYVYFIY
jgi:hypothetical protein